MTLEEVVVFAIVALASAFVLRRLSGYVPKKKKKPGPDVPVDRLVRRKKPPSG
jgi:hypothetical protein